MVYVERHTNFQDQPSRSFQIFFTPTAELLRGSGNGITISPDRRCHSSPSYSSSLKLTGRLSRRSRNVPAIRTKKLQVKKLSG